MKFKMFLAATLAAALMGIGTLAGSVVGAGNASAQTPAATATPSAANPTSPGGGSTAPSSGMPGGFGPGGPGMHGGRDGFGMEPFGGTVTADNANSAISNTTTFISSVKSDLAYANGKMDTTDVQKWISGADSLLASAQSANSASRYEQAVQYAGAARELAMLAEQQMALKLGAANLPSYANRPARPDNDNNGTTAATPTQAQASRILEQTYNQLVMQGAVISNGSSTSKDATSYLTDAQNAYKAAYNSYQSGNYSDAVSSARVVERLAHVASQVLRAANAPADPNTPITVPAPTF